MKIEVRKLGLSGKLDELSFIRADGSVSRISMPRQGILPHDLLHFVVESAMPLLHGFLSLVAGGADATLAMTALHSPEQPNRAIEGTQVEALVEALQAQLWAGSFDLTLFLQGVQLACAARGVVPPVLSGIDFETALFDKAVDLNEQWIRLAPQQSMTFVFERTTP